MTPPSFRHPPFRHFRESGNDKVARAALQPGFHIVERRFSIFKFNYRCPIAVPHVESESADARLFRLPLIVREAFRAVSRSLFSSHVLSLAFSFFFFPFSFLFFVL